MKSCRPETLLVGRIAIGARTCQGLFSGAISEVWRSNQPWR